MCFKKCVYIFIVKHIIYCLLSIIYNYNIVYASAKTIKVVIDPGHGGIDPGAKGNSLKEKDIVLKVALELGHLLEANHKNISVVYTRSKDKFIPVFQRTIIARDKADIFISIHCNASTETKANGAETYIMSVEQLTSTSAAAKRENAVVLLEKKFKEIYKDFNSKASDSHIIFALQNNSSHNNSLRLAQIVQDEMKKIGLRNRGVRQDRFILFYRSLVPSILVEIGYITNKNDAAYMNSLEGRKSIATALSKAIGRYLMEVESIEGGLK